MNHIASWKVHMQLVCKSNHLKVIFYNSMQVQWCTIHSCVTRPLLSYPACTLSWGKGYNTMSCLSQWCCHHVEVQSQWWSTNDSTSKSIQLSMLFPTLSLTDKPVKKDFQQNKWLTTKENVVRLCEPCYNSTRLIANSSKIRQKLFFSLTSTVISRK